MEPYWQGYIAWYHRWLASSAYRRAVERRLAPLLAGAESLLDIGSGTGLFSLGAPHGVRLTAVEGSAEMNRLFESELAKAERSAEIITANWEDAALGGRTFSVVLSANSVYQMRPLEDALRKMYDAADKHLLVVMNSGTRTAYGKIRQALAAEGVPLAPIAAGHTADEVEAAWQAMGLIVSRTDESWAEEYRFRAKEDLIYHILTRLKLSSNFSPTVSRILEDFIVYEQHSVKLDGTMRMAFFHADKGVR